MIPYDNTGFGSRMRRVTNQMLADVDSAYKQLNLPFRSRYFPIFWGLQQREQMTVSELTELSGFTQPATSQTLKALQKKGLVALQTGIDGRERVVTLTRDGKALLGSLQPFWNKAATTLNDLLEETTPRLDLALASLESALEKKPLVRRLLEATQPQPQQSVDVIPFRMEFAQAFRDLNLEWLEKWFEVEPYDRVQLEQPEKILEQGGEIFIAILDNKAVGTGALYFRGDGEYEIAKMAVDPSHRGSGIGVQLMQRLINRFKERGGRRLFLVTSSKLAPAIGLYRKFGFVDFVPRNKPEYDRADTFMEWAGDPS